MDKMRKRFLELFDLVCAELDVAGTQAQKRKALHAVPPSDLESLIILLPEGFSELPGGAVEYADVAFKAQMTYASLPFIFDRALPKRKTRWERINTKNFVFE